MNKNNKSVIQQWSMPAKELPIEYPKLMAKINGWKADDGRLFIYTKKLQVSLSNAIISGKLIVRDNFTGLYLEPGLDAYKYGIIDFQDFCDWANKAGLFGVPDNALKLAHAFEMPTETYLSESQQAFSLTLEATTSPAPEPQDAPVVAVGASGGSELEFTLLATREDLIEAFKSFTGMDMCWFDNLKDSPKLLEARKIKGTSGRNNSGPLFCPYEVMLWLIDPKRKKGRKLSDEKAWELLKSHFPKVYDLKSIGSPNPD